MVELVGLGSRFSPGRLDKVVTKLQRGGKEDASRCRALANNLAIVAVLITTVTFAAAFTLPGGYSGRGMAVLGRRWAFRVFLTSDAAAMVSSIVAACALIHTGSQDHDVRLHSLGVAMKLIWVALGCMVVAFATGAYVAVESESLWLGVLICLVACSAPLLVWLTTYWPVAGPRRAKNNGTSSQLQEGPEEEVGTCRPLLHYVPKSKNPLMSTTVEVVSSRMPQIDKFPTPGTSQAAAEDRSF